MTDHQESEKELFEDQAFEEFAVPAEEKRRSFGPRLRIPPPREKASAMSTSPSSKEPGTGSQSARRSSSPSLRKPGAGTVLGIEGTFDRSRPELLTIKNDAGKDVVVNVFEDVMTGYTLSLDRFEKLLNYLHASGKLDFAAFIEDISYQGFDRAFYIRSSLQKVSVSQFARFAIMGAIRGSNFQKIVDSSISVPQDLITLVNNGTVIKKAKKRSDMTILRFTASIPHWVAYWLLQNNIQKKIVGLDCDACLQFPGAASLPMGKRQRFQHIEFCQAFSSLLPGGTFNKNIYYTAYMNGIPSRDVPKMLKPILGIDPDDTQSGTVSPAEVSDHLSKQVAVK